MTPIDWSLFSRPRYCDRSFPPYRFAPGAYPHPTAHPAGHSYRAPGLEVAAHPTVSAADWDDCEEYLYGCDLYNHAYWWEAHEAWEDVWRGLREDQRERRFLQGLIQTSACHFQLYLGRLAGVGRLLRTSDEHLATLSNAPRFMGLDVAEFRRSIRTYYSQVLREPTAGEKHQAEMFPYLVLHR